MLIVTQTSRGTPSAPAPTARHFLFLGFQCVLDVISQQLAQRSGVRRQLRLIACLIPDILIDGVEDFCRPRGTLGDGDATFILLELDGPEEVLPDDQPEEN